MKNNVCISIIIPCYNDHLFVEQAVNSALNQTYLYKEVIVIDDGSNQQTKEVLKSLEPKIDLLITQENSGQSTARNRGIKAAKGEYILILDSDDFFEPTFCEIAIQVISKENIKIVTCWSNLIYDNKKIEIYKPQGGVLLDFLYLNAAMGSLLIQKKDWERFNGYDENMRKGMEDWEFYIRLLSNGGSVYVIEEVLFNYRKRNKSTTSIANTNKYEILKYIYLKNKELYIEHFALTIDNLIAKIEHQENERYKNLNRLEYKIGFRILQPIRFLKKIMKL